jgi:cob(I)alamin adenosyltransferase
MAKVYTKTGDTGLTSLVSGTRVPKGDDRIDLYGEVDELNSHIGVGVSYLDKNNYHEDLVVLTKIQNTLFNLGSNLACEQEFRLSYNLPQINPDLILQLEGRMDQMNLVLPELRNFILPGGTIAASYFHVCRTVCRRIERKLVFFNSTYDDLPDHAVSFINRLSDYFFVFSRYINHLESQVEIIWQKDN